MFTGIVEDTGTVVRWTPTPSGQRLVVRTALDVSDTRLGDSISVDGVCLTVVERGRDGGESGSGGALLAFDVGPETLAVTTFRDVISPGRRVHLERAVRLCDRLGGHLVTGHVDGVGTVRRRRESGDALFLDVDVPDDVLAMCIEKGSIAIDGVSLTLNVVDDRGVQVCLIPHTLVRTHLGALRQGDRVNLESDVLGKYVRRLLRLAPSTPASAGVTLDLLARAGFLGDR